MVVASGHCVGGDMKLKMIKAEAAKPLTDRHKTAASGLIDTL